MRRFYTTTEVAEMLQLTRRTIYTYIKDGSLKAVKYGKQFRISEDDLTEFLNRGTEGSETENQDN